VRDELLAAHPRDPAEMRRHLADYYAAITCLDHHMARVFEAFRAAGRDEQTVVLYTSDQGLAVGGRHGLMGKQNLYEHVKPPLVLAGPAIPHGQSHALVYLFDLFPTLCDLARLERPGGLEGKSLAGVIKGNSLRVRETLFAAYKESQRMVRDERMKLLWYPAVNRHQLFDLARDPWEVEDLSAREEFAPQLAALKRLMAQSQREFGDPTVKP
jgi:arylsulfatase A-like enzyme